MVVKLVRRRRGAAVEIRGLRELFKLTSIFVGMVMMQQYYLINQLCINFLRPNLKLKLLKTQIG